MAKLWDFILRGTREATLDNIRSDCRNEKVNKKFTNLRETLITKDHFWWKSMVCSPRFRLNVGSTFVILSLFTLGGRRYKYWFRKSEQPITANMMFIFHPANGRNTKPIVTLLARVFPRFAAAVES